MFGRNDSQWLARSVLFVLLVVCTSERLSAQNGSNFFVLNNGTDVIYGGIGAGGSCVPCVDGVGIFILGECLRGNTLTNLGDFGYRETAWREEQCVIGSAGPGLRLSFPLITTIELDGFNPYSTDNVFTMAVCPTASCFPLGNSVGVAPYGFPAGSSGASFVVAGLPSGLGLPSSKSILLPNNLIPTTLGGTATLIAALTSVTIPIASTGFCWVVHFGWAPSALASNDDITGWWSWRSSGLDNNQYWGISNDETNIWQSQSVATTGGISTLLQFTSNLDYAYHSLSATPISNVATAPTGFNGTGPFYATGAGVSGSGSSINGGFDMGRHGGLSLSGTGGTPNPFTGVGNQDPVGAATAGFVPTLGFVTYNNGPSTTLGTTRYALQWVQVNTDLTFGIDPALGGDALVFFGSVRVPVPIPTIPGPWPQPLTTTFFPLYLQTITDHTGDPGWPDPNSLAAGSFGVTPMEGASVHLPTASAGSVSIGLPVGLSAASSSLVGPTGPLHWGDVPGTIALTGGSPSVTRLIILID